MVKVYEITWGETQTTAGVIGGSVVTYNIAFAGGSPLSLQSSAPATADTSGVAGAVRYDANYIYICIAENTWKRAALETWSPECSNSPSSYVILVESGDCYP